MYRELEVLGQLLRWDFLSFCELLRETSDEAFARLQELIQEPGWAQPARKAVEVEALRRELKRRAA